MNDYQAAWYVQVRSDYDVLLQLQQTEAPPCHQLHYLQMVTEKLGKAYFWRTGQPPRASHASFVRFLQALDDRSAADVTFIAELLGFGTAHGFAAWIRSIAPLAYALQRLAPGLAGLNAPNAEYPWPFAAPVNVPAQYDFPVWQELRNSGRGQQFLRVLDSAVVNFPQFA